MNWGALYFNPILLNYTTEKSPQELELYVYLHGSIILFTFAMHIYIREEDLKTTKIIARKRDYTVIKHLSCLTT